MSAQIALEVTTFPVIAIYQAILGILWTLKYLLLSLWGCQRLAMLVGLQVGGVAVAMLCPQLIIGIGLIAAFAWATKRGF